MAYILYVNITIYNCNGVGEYKEMVHLQRTIREAVGCKGIGLHSGKRVNLILKPAPPGTGIVFIRTDLPNRPEIAVRYENIHDTTRATTIHNNGAIVSTVEHLLASIFALGIDNLLIELDSNEVPIMDGSAAPFVLLLKSAGLKLQPRPKEFIIVKDEVSIADGDRHIQAFPSKRLKVSFLIQFDHPVIQRQEYHFEFSTQAFEREISRARTFGFLNEVEKLQEMGFALGGSLENAVVLDRFNVLNSEGLRYPDEFVRHKILDFLGDMALLGTPVLGHFVVHKSGHALNRQFLKRLYEASKKWTKVAFKTEKELKKERIFYPLRPLLPSSI